MTFEEVVASFVNELNKLIRDVLGFPAKLFADHVVQDGLPRVVISISDFNGIPINIAGLEVLNLQIKYLCEFRTGSGRLTVVNSTYKVSFKGNPEPLWQYDYVRDMKKASSAIAHLNVYAHRNEIVAAMVKSKRFPKNMDVRSLHFPFGGPRFRPTIEDVLEMLISEFKIDIAHGAKAKLKKSREIYFNRQLEGAVFDSPEVAAASLRYLGYQVESPSLL